MIEINNQSGDKLDIQFLRVLGEQILQQEGARSSMISVALVKARKIRELNKKYRRRDYVANVLSFPAGNERIPSEVEEYLGEIILCPSKIRKDAKKYGTMFQEELARVFVHGLLHLLGYNHKQMQTYV